ncbi:MAG: bifunctional protein FolD [Patescibacteria group bacterium]|nr:MAG: bifunctional protein FolD [Patescibacteria group bacterium]
MQIRGNYLAEKILDILANKKAQLKNKNLRLCAIYVGKDSEQLGYLKKKEEIAKRLGIEFKLKHITKKISFQKLAEIIHKIANNPKTTGVIIQQPIPSELQTNTIYDFIPRVKEIEGFSDKSPFFPPLGLAVLTILKYIYLAEIYNNPDEKINDLIVYPEIKERYLHKIYENPESIKLDKYFFKDTFSDKKIVLLGRGLTGGGPIAKTLNEFGLNFINIHSGVPDPSIFTKEADIIISAVGKKKVLTADMVKDGCILINVGLHKTNGKIAGDFSKKEMEPKAKFFTSAVNGIGPLNIAYIYKNLIESALFQEKGIEF